MRLPELMFGSLIMIFAVAFAVARYIRFRAPQHLHRLRTFAYAGVFISSLALLILELRDPIPSVMACGVMTLSIGISWLGLIEELNSQSRKQKAN